MGGRMCSMAVAEGLPAAGLVLLAYPLHPPGRPADLRTAHLPRLRVPTLFVHGQADPFGSLEEMELARTLIPAPTALLRAAGGHDLGARRGPTATLVEGIQREFTRLMTAKTGNPD
jgi:predicted alpha/beta-hydrolase family hydrolase